MFFYAIKRIIRSMGLFAALLLGVVLASTFFAGINVGADTTAKAALDQQLSHMAVDIVVSQFSQFSSQTSTSADWKAALSEIADINGIVGTEVISRAYWDGNTTFGNYTSLRIVGISNESKVHERLIVTSGVSPLGANETYVWAGSKNVGEIPLNSTLTVNLTYRTSDYPSLEENEENLTLSLKVVGVVELDDVAYSIVSGGWYGPIVYQSLQEQSRPIYGDNLFLVSWEKTLAKLLDTVSSSVPYYSNPFSTQILVYLDRGALISPWDIPSSVEAVRRITGQVSAEVIEYGLSASNNLENVLATFQFASMQMRFSFFVVALPVFFVAWYVGTTVSDVSYNLRRREIGLLLTKGFSSGQIFRMFLTEAVLIGLVGSLIGAGLGLLLTPVFANAVGGGLGAAPVLSQEVIVMSIVFGLTITLLSTYRPSRKASKLPAIDALREYMYVEEIKPYRQRWPWVAFALGLYKIVTFLFGINLFQAFTGPPPFANIFLLIILGAWITFDYFILTYIGPLLFFWGFTKIFIRGSLKFQELVTRSAKFLGDLGTLATRNVRRNPARAASVAFLIALIVGYSFQTIGSLASEQDYAIRRAKADVGADITIQLASVTNMSGAANAIGETQGVASTALEYSIYGTLFLPYRSSIQIRAIDPDEWLATAYYESEWFIGTDITTALQQMKTDNETIILEWNLARSLDKKLGNNITILFSDLTLELRIVGFFGSESSQQPFWSYVPVGVYELLKEITHPVVKILVRVENGADGKSVATEIRNLDPTFYVRSVAEELETYQSDFQLMGSLNIQRIGVVFSILAAAVGTSLVTLVSLQERKREASIMNARGLSFKQLVTMFFAENLAIVVFSVILGVIVGLIVVRGNIAASNTTLSYSLVAHRMIFPPDAIIILSTCIALVFASAIIPVIVLTKRYISKTERIVRL